MGVAQPRVAVRGSIRMLDHRTAFDIAGRAAADASSLLTALKMAGILSFKTQGEGVSRFILTLTRADRTVTDVLTVYESPRDVQVTHVGLKDIGLPF
jgi:hypothetical protein